MEKVGTCVKCPGYNVCFSFIQLCYVYLLHIKNENVMKSNWTKLKTSPLEPNILLVTEVQSLYSSKVWLFAKVRIKLPAREYVNYFLINSRLIFNCQALLVSLKTFVRLIWIWIISA